MKKRHLPFIAGDKVEGLVSEDQSIRTLAELKDMSGEIEQTDLHECGSREIAESQTRQFLDKLIFNREKFGRIIFGKGKGVLAAMVGQVIEEYKEKGLVKDSFLSKNIRAAGAATVVIME